MCKTEMFYYDHKTFCIQLVFPFLTFRVEFWTNQRDWQIASAINKSLLASFLQTFVAKLYGKLLHTTTSYYHVKLEPEKRRVSDLWFWQVCRKKDAIKMKGFFGKSKGNDDENVVDEAITWLLICRK